MTSSEPLIFDRGPGGAIAPARIGGRWPRAQKWLMPLAVLMGIVCMVAQYAADRSFWIDEAFLVLNIRTKTMVEFLTPMDFDQVAPPLFMMAERGMFHLFGGGEMSLRLLPLVCGIAGLVLFPFVARRVLPSPWDALATVLFALSDHLIYHDAELKPYGPDVFVCVLLLFLVVNGRAGRPALWRLAWLAGAAAVGVLFSFPAVFVFAGLSLALMPAVVAEDLPAADSANGNSIGRMRRWLRGTPRYVLVNLPVVLAFALLLFFSGKSQGNEKLAQYWDADFLNVHRIWTWPIWILRHVQAMCNYAFPLAGPVVFVGAIVGAVALYRMRRRELLAMLLGPLVIALLAAAARKYPFDGARLTVFLTPCVLLLAIAGLQAFYSGAPRSLRRLTLVPVIYVLIVAVTWAVVHLVYPRNRGHLRPVAAYVRRHIGPADTIYCFDLRVLQCYWPADDCRVHGEIYNARQIRTRRFWVVWTFSSPKGEKQLDDVLRWIGQFCDEKDRMESNGGAAVLFERRDDALPEKLEPPLRRP